MSQPTGSSAAIRPHIVVVDDEPSVRELLRECLQDEGYHVTAVPDGQAALQLVMDEPVNVVISDLRLQGMDGVEVIERVSRQDAQIICVVMTGYGTIECAVRAMKAGAFDFITKPIQLDAVSLVVKKALEFQRLRQENALLRKTVREKYALGQMIGASDEIRAVQAFVEKVADSDSTVLIQGESGTGKELVARMLHFNSIRRDRPLVAVNCGAIPENLLESELFGHEKGAFTGAITARTGRFELAHGGTLFLDEIGEMSLALQVKLLRVLQDRCFERVGGVKTIRVDVRIIAATNQDLEQAVETKRFRQDLFYRLNVIPITIPPLRERRSDIPILIDHFIKCFNESKRAGITGVDRESMVALTQHHWPGNIRELENLVERIVILKQAGAVTLADLPDKIVQAPLVCQSKERETGGFTNGEVNLVQELERYENRLITEALRRSNGVTSRAAQLLNLNRTTLVEKMKRKGLDAKVHGIASA
jgi:two-component system response regulator AtoC